MTTRKVASSRVRNNHPMDQKQHDLRVEERMGERGRRRGIRGVRGYGVYKMLV